jgi:hypothetical protein
MFRHKAEDAYGVSWTSKEANIELLIMHERKSDLQLQETVS